MKRKLALQLLQSIIPGLRDEGQTADLFSELQFLAEYKYNKYEMYHPGRRLCTKTATQVPVIVATLPGRLSIL
jgi:hypothetical protein